MDRPELDPKSRASREPSAQDHWDAMVADVSTVASTQRWGQSLIAIGWVHLAIFAACQAIYTPEVRSESRHPMLWAAEMAMILWILRRFGGRGWRKATPLVGVVARVWLTFLILAFNAATLNSLTGWTLDWFKLAWCGLSSFGFATMAWLFGPRWLIPAVWMYFTGLLMVQFPLWHYAIYGASWWAALQAIGLVLERRRRAFEGRSPDWKSEI